MVRAERVSQLGAPPASGLKSQQEFRGRGQPLIEETIISLPNHLLCGISRLTQRSMVRKTITDPGSCEAAVNGRNWPQLLL